MADGISEGHEGAISHDGVTQTRHFIARCRRRLMNLSLMKSLWPVITN